MSMTKVIFIAPHISSHKIVIVTVEFDSHFKWNFSWMGVFTNAVFYSDPTKFQIKIAPMISRPKLPAQTACNFRMLFYKPMIEKIPKIAERFTILILNLLTYFDSYYKSFLVHNLSRHKYPKPSSSFIASWFHRIFL